MRNVKLVLAHAIYGLLALGIIGYVVWAGVTAFGWKIVLGILGVVGVLLWAARVIDDN